jgi:hypothetical protein
MHCLFSITTWQHKNVFLEFSHNVNFFFTKCSATHGRSKERVHHTENFMEHNSASVTSKHSL